MIDIESLHAIKKYIALYDYSAVILIREEIQEDFLKKLGIYDTIGIVEYKVPKNRKAIQETLFGIPIITFKQETKGEVIFQAFQKYKKVFLVDDEKLDHFKIGDRDEFLRNFIF